MPDKEDTSREELIRALLASKVKRETSATPALINKLKSLHRDLVMNAENFFPGAIVVWKEGMRNKKFPLGASAAVVIEHLDHPVIDSEEKSGSPYFREPLDLIAGCLGEEGEFVIFHFDSRRFKHLESV